MAVLLARGQITIAAIKDGKDGAQGKPGKDGITWTLTPDILTYDTDDSGKAINVGTGKATTLRVLRGNEELKNFTIKGVKNMVNCVASRLNNTSSFYITAITVQKVTLGTDTMDVSCTNGSFDVEFAVDGVTYTATAKFAVNVSAFTGRMTLNNKQYESKFTEISNKFNKDLADAESRITQAAREISLSVSEKSIGRRNLLVGSAFLREDNNCTISKDARIEINSGYQGTNCIHVIDATEAGNPHYVGAYWDGSQGGRSIKIEKGKKYTMSCFYKTNDINGEFWLEAIYTDKQENATRKGQAKYLSPNGHTVKKVNEWELFTTVVDTTDAEYDYIAFNFWEACNVIAGQINAWICRPMVEEGDTYNGWTLSQNDYDYVGGNLLEDTMALTRSSDKSNLQLASGLIMFEKYEGCYGILYNKNNSAESQFTEALQYKFPTTATLSGQARIVKNQDYVFSFVAKGSGNINVYLYGDSVHANVYTETCEGNEYPDGRVDGYAQLALTSTYKRYWVHWRIEDYTGEGAEVIPDKVLIRVPGDTEAWVTKPKLEEGAQLTDYTERKTDLIDRATAKAAGLEITADGVELYGNKVKVKNNGKTAAMFTDGKLNADLIDADTINVHHVWAKDGNNQNTLAHFGNYGIIEAKDEEGRSCPLWVGSSTASSSPFRVSKDGYMYAEKGAFGIRYYEDEESGEQRAYGRFEITANGIETGEVFKEDSMSLTDTRFHLIKQKGNNEKLSNDAIFLDSHGDTLPVPGLGVYLKAKVRVDASGVLNSESNVCYYANAKNGLQNYAIYGSGDISLDGSVYAYKATMVNLKTKNVFLDNTGSIGVTTYNEPQTIDSLTLLVNSQNGLALTLPTLGTIEQMLFGVYSARSKFCVRLTIIMDVGSTSINLRGRCLAKDQAGVAQWNHADFPLMFNWNGNYASDFNMAEGDSCEFLLTYDPNKNYKAGIFEQPYIARIINLQY